MGLRNIEVDFAQHFLLRFSQRERQRFDELSRERFFRRELRGAAFAALAVMHAHRELLRQ